MSLRGRITVALVVILAVGLGISATATSAALRRALRHRVDEQLREVEPLAREQLRRQAAGTAAPARSSGGKAAASSGASAEEEVLVARIDREGDVVDRVVPPLSRRAGVLDEVPEHLLVEARAGKVAWADVTIGGQPYRIRVKRLDAHGNVAAMLAPLRDVNSTLDHLRHLELVVGGVLLVLAVGASWWFVGVGLRPLSAMTDTADAIAGGAVDRRVGGGRGRRGEVPRLARALDNAFDERQRAEAKLRRFVIDASHELRTPLTSIRGYAELHRSGALADAAASDRALGRIESEADRMAALVDDLLLLARLEEGRPPTSGPVDLGVLAADAVADARAAGPEWPVELAGTPSLTVLGDEARIRQVLANLLANVRSHCPPGTRTEVSVRSDGAEAHIEVADHGPGLDPEQAALVFDRFWRADPSRRHPDGRLGGSGLGLSIVAAIAASHGGRAEVAATAGGGATFRVVVPVLPVPALSDAG